MFSLWNLNQKINKYKRLYNLCIVYQSKAQYACDVLGCHQPLLVSIAFTFITHVLYIINYVHTCVYSYEGYELCKFF